MPPGQTETSRIAVAYEARPALRAGSGESAPTRLATRGWTQDGRDVFKRVTAWGAAQGRDGSASPRRIVVFDAPGASSRRSQRQEVRSRAQPESCESFAFEALPGAVRGLARTLAGPWSPFFFLCSPGDGIFSVIWKPDCNGNRIGDREEPPQDSSENGVFDPCETPVACNSSLPASSCRGLPP